MSAWLSPVCGRAFTMLSILTASTRFSEGTGSPVNGDRSGPAGDGDGAAAPLACPPWRSAIYAPVTRPARRTTASTVMSVLCRAHIIGRPGPRLGATARAGRGLHLLSTIVPGYQGNCPMPKARRSRSLVTARVVIAAAGHRDDASAGRGYGAARYG